MFGKDNVGLHEVVVDCVAGVEITSSFSADLLDVHDPVECMGGANCVYVLRRFWLATFCYVLNRIAPKKGSCWYRPTAVFCHYNYSIDSTIAMG